MHYLQYNINVLTYLIRPYAPTGAMRHDDDNDDTYSTYKNLLLVSLRMLTLKLYIYILTLLTILILTLLTT